MFIKLKLILVLLASGLFSQLQAQSHDNIQWNQFRGVNRDGVSSESINESWSEKAPQLVWKSKIGEGFSEVVVANDILYTMDSDSATAKEYLVSMESKTGKIIWRTAIDSLFIDVDGFGNGPRSTPAIDNEMAYCLSSYGKLIALNLKSGKIKWSIDFVKAYESTLPRWAYSTSPLILGDHLFVEIGGSNKRGFASINKKSGDINWIKGHATASYSSPTIAKINDITNIVFANDTMLTAYNLSGDKLWDYRMPLQSPTAAPLFIAPNKFFVSSAGRAGGFVVEVNGAETKELFTSQALKSHFSTAVYHDGFIYGFSNALLRCISAETGELKWSKIKLGKGSLIKVSNKLLVLSDKGLLKLVDTNPEAYTELGSVQTISGKSWTAPSFGNGHVYLRNLGEIASYKID